MKNPLIIIIGPGKTFGVDIARKFGLNGYDILLVGKNQDKLKYCSELLNGNGINSSFLSVDLKSEDSIRSIFINVEKEGRSVAAVIFNAVTRRNSKPSELNGEKLIGDFKVNVSVAVECFHVVSQIFQKQGHGAMLFTGGGVALKPSLEAASMSLCKAALRNYVLNLAHEYSGTGIYIGLLTITKPVSETSDINFRIVADCFYRMFRERNDTEYFL
ncbi:MAG: SDR family NAD(P)-dependent oxidoreductase [Rikenellaceae bacterium]|nr:SDR family NAD(P)-dependent oxidoreductase [Rikenellaceae bacterium]